MKNLEQLNTQNNAEGDNTENKNYPLMTSERLEGTPFTIINQEGKWFLVMGDHRITEPTKTREETLEKSVTEHWMIILTMVAIAVEKTIDQMKIEGKIGGPLEGTTRTWKEIEIARQEAAEEEWTKMMGPVTK